MRDPTPKTIYLRDYTPPPFLIDHVELLLELDETVTRITSTLRLRRNPAD